MTLIDKRRIFQRSKDLALQFHDKTIPSFEGIFFPEAAFFPSRSILRVTLEEEIHK